jgi:hypothetical protein
MGIALGKENEKNNVQATVCPHLSPGGRNTPSTFRGKTAGVILDRLGEDRENRCR